MKKFIAFALALLLVAGLLGCSKAERKDQPFYFIGEIVLEDAHGTMVKVVDYGNHAFASEEVILCELTLGEGYAIGDYIRVEFDGLFLETNPPQIPSAILITKTDAP